MRKSAFFYANRFDASHENRKTLAPQHFFGTGASRIPARRSSPCLNPRISLEVQMITISNATT